MKENLLTRPQEINAPIFKRVDEMFKEMGEMPYGQVPATPKEQRDAYNKLTYPELQELREKHGVVELQKYVKAMRGK